MLNLHASSIGAAIGQNAYQSRGKLLYNLLYSNSRRKTLYYKKRSKPSPKALGRKLESHIIQLYESNNKVKCYDVECMHLHTPL